MLFCAVFPEDERSDRSHPAIGMSMVRRQLDAVEKS